MVVLRCTRKLLRRLRTTPAEDAPTSSTLLGDWYMNVLFVWRRCPLDSSQASRECWQHSASGRTRFEKSSSTWRRSCSPESISRQILGSMNDFDRMLDPAPGESLASAALELAEAPCGPIGMQSPDRATIGVFANAPETSH